MLYRRGKIWHYDFAAAAKRHRGSTRQTSESRARKVESKLISRAEQIGPSVILRRAPLLRFFAPRFTNWFENAPSLSPKTRRYYRMGLARIMRTGLAGMTIDRITTEEVDQLGFDGSPAWVNQGLRTLRRLLGKALEWGIITSAPRIKLVKEQGRELTIDPESEAKLLAAGKQPMKDVLVIVQTRGCALRRSFEFASRISIGIDS